MGNTGTVSEALLILADSSLESHPEYSFLATIFLKNIHLIKVLISEFDQKQKLPLTTIISTAQWEHSARLWVTLQTSGETAAPCFHVRGPKVHYKEREKNKPNSLLLSRTLPALRWNTTIKYYAATSMVKCEEEPEKNITSSWQWDSLSGFWL